MSEDQKPKRVVIQADLLRVDVPMDSGNIYTREAVENAMQEFKKRIVAGAAMGAVEPDLESGIRIEEMSHVVTSVYMRDDVLAADLEILPTPRGQFLINWLKAGGEIRVAPRAEGDVGEDHVVRDLEISGVDIWRVHDDDEIEEDESSDPG